MNWQINRIIIDNGVERGENYNIGGVFSFKMLSSLLWMGCVPHAFP